MNTINDDRVEQASQELKAEVEAVLQHADLPRLKALFDTERLTPTTIFLDDRGRQTSTFYTMLAMAVVNGSDADYSPILNYLSSKNARLFLYKPRIGNPIDITGMALHHPTMKSRQRQLLQLILEMLKQGIEPGPRYPFDKSSIYNSGEEMRDLVNQINRLEKQMVRLEKLPKELRSKIGYNDMLQNIKIVPLAKTLAKPFKLTKNNGTRRLYSGDHSIPNLALQTIGQFVSSSPKNINSLFVKRPDGTPRKRSRKSRRYTRRRR